MQEAIEKEIKGKTHLTKPDKQTARTPSIQQTAAPVSGKKPPPSRCALSRWSKTGKGGKSRNIWHGCIWLQNYA